MRNNIKHTLIAGGSFAGGILAGLLLNTRKSQIKVFLGNINSTCNWLEKKGQHVLNKSEVNLQKISERLKNSVSNPLPDLYSATESFCLNEEDLLDV